jgi:hypothetical protein
MHPGHETYRRSFVNSVVKPGAPHNAVSGSERRAQIGRVPETIASLSMPRSDTARS